LRAHQNNRPGAAAGLSGSVDQAVLHFFATRGENGRRECRASPVLSLFLFGCFLWIMLNFSSQKLYTFPKNPRAFVIQIAAKYAGVNVEVVSEVNFLFIFRLSPASVFARFSFSKQK
jgi:hypothetical protein